MIGEAVLTAAFETLFGGLVKGCNKHLSRLRATHPNLRLPRPPFGRRGLEKRLQAKYPNTEFHVSPTREAFYRTTAETLVRLINIQMATTSTNSLDPTRAKVGIVCGPMVHKVVQQIARRRMPGSRKDFSELKFVAMNKAAESDTFQFSANHLVTLLSSTFPHSKPLAYTYNSYDRNSLDDARESVDILLCSAGSHPHSPPNYLEIWCSHMRQQGVDTGGHENKVLILPGNCIGDFCLTPIDADGRKIDPDTHSALLKAFDDGLDPHPRFARVSEVARSGNTKVIFPLNLERPTSHQSPQGSRGPTPLTGKEAVASTILHSGIVTVCILERAVARNLATSVGGIFVDRISKAEPGKPLREAHAFMFRDPKTDVKIHIYDPYSRFDSVCRVDVRLHSQPYPCTQPKITVSEYTNETGAFDSSRGDGSIQFNIGGLTHKFTLFPEVRKPGRFSLATFHLVNKTLAEMAQQRPSNTHLSLWDLGCGCGIVGILAREFCHDTLKRVLFSDTSEPALKSTLANLRAKDGTELTKGDLFSASPDGETFDVIAFNPPFIPQGMADHRDVGGKVGPEAAARFCRGLREHLKRGGCGILTLADYIDDGSIQKTLAASGFGSDDIVIEEQVILYPFQTDKLTAQAYEIANKAALEAICGYKFEICWLGNTQFLAFKIRRSCAHRVD